ncbi:60S ribosomal protein L18, putative [Leishmania tarentolae]|uniref:60S ribosomal protein L18, putative n=1 Tax=Leishmania tarentolae TaxID=5689 RepID=A0A640L183_LEITA|nr:60S ribosomal protein L18, putative [Leishmania tarentolae]
MTEGLALVRLTCAAAALRLLAAVGRVRLRVAARHTRGTEVAHRLTARLATTQQVRVLASRSNHGELVEGQALTAGSDDALASALGEAQGADAHRGDAGHAHIIQNVTHHDGDRGFLALRGEDSLALHHDGDAAQRNRGAVAAALDQALVHDLVEARARALREELVQLNQQLDIGVRRVRVMANHTTLLGDASQIDAHDCHERYATRCTYSPAVS